MIGWVEVAAPYGAGGLGIGVGIWIAKLLGQGITWTLTFFTGRLDKKEADLDEQEGRLNQRLETQIERLTVRLDRVEAELEECKRLHAEERSRRMELEAMLQGMGDARNIIQRSLAADHLDENKAKPKG